MLSEEWYSSSSTVKGSRNLVPVLEVEPVGWEMEHPPAPQQVHPFKKNFRETPYHTSSHSFYRLSIRPRTHAQREWRKINSLLPLAAWLRSHFGPSPLGQGVSTSSALSRLNYPFISKRCGLSDYWHSLNALCDVSKLAATPDCPTVVVLVSMLTLLF